MANNTKKELIIEGIRDLQDIMAALINNGYEVGIKPVYETQEEVEKRYGVYARRGSRPKHYIVTIGEKIGKGDDEQCLED